ncbi:hypothetical protein BHM03_00032429 [Ensete ventricosum]|nr:hypothetical protein BHM03_00032429 [Ensete ventricosum]
MEGKPAARFSLGKQSSLAPERDDDRSAEVRLSGGPAEKATQVPEEIGSGIRLMFLANEGDLDGIKEVLGSGADVNFRDIDGRTALHVAACQGFADIAQLLLRMGAEADPEDRWGSTRFFARGRSASPREEMESPVGDSSTSGGESRGWPAIDGRCGELVKKFGQSQVQALGRSEDDAVRNLPGVRRELA